MNTEKRNVRTYKVKDKPYFAAKKKCKGTLAIKLEKVVEALADGRSVTIEEVVEKK